MTIAALQRRFHRPNRLRREQASERMVTEGRVNCPHSARGDVDVDWCYACPQLSKAEFDDSGPVRIRCELVHRTLRELEERPI